MTYIERKCGITARQAIDIIKGIKTEKPEENSAISLVLILLERYLKKGESEL